MMRKRICSRELIGADRFRGGCGTRASEGWFAPGGVLAGRRRILAQDGCGGMGEVYKVAERAAQGTV